MQLLKLVREQIQLGEPLPWGVRDSHAKLLLARGHVIHDENLMTALLTRGVFVDVEEVEARRAEALAAQAASKAPAFVPKQTLFTQWSALLAQLDGVLRNATDAAQWPGELAALARLAMTLTRRDPDIAIYLAVRQDPTRLKGYGVLHSLHCAMVGCLVATRLGWDEARTLTLLEAALTMNMACLDLQGVLASQDGPPTEKQRALIRLHPSLAVDMLRERGVVDAEWLRTVAEHHERPDGSGYPSGLKATDELASALRHVDVFMAKMAPRANRAALAVQVAARQLFQDDGGGPVSMAIIKEFGIYPPGDLVQLKSGEVAVVVRRGASASTPMAACLTDRHGKPHVFAPVRDTRQAEFAISATVADKSLVLRVLPERLYGLAQ